MQKKNKREKEIIIGLENNKDQYKAYKLQDIESIK